MTTPAMTNHRKSPYAVPAATLAPTDSPSSLPNISERTTVNTVANTALWNRCATHPTVETDAPYSAPITGSVPVVA